MTFWMSIILKTISTFPCQIKSVVRPFARTSLKWFSGNGREPRILTKLTLSDGHQVYLFKVWRFFSISSVPTFISFNAAPASHVSYVVFRTQSRYIISIRKLKPQHFPLHKYIKCVFLCSHFISIFKMIHIIIKKKNNSNHYNTLYKLFIKKTLF